VAGPAGGPARPRRHTLLSGPSIMVLYEVSIRVTPEASAAYRDWLTAHVAEMLAFEGFTRAEVFEDDPDADGAARLVVHYHVRDVAALDRYLAEDAPRMRADGLARFGDRFTATRRILRRVQTFGA
jgi:quinol monooxygenase YgiN